MQLKTDTGYYSLWMLTSFPSHLLKFFPLENTKLIHTYSKNNYNDSTFFMSLHQIELLIPSNQSMCFLASVIWKVGDCWRWQLHEPPPFLWKMEQLCSSTNLYIAPYRNGDKLNHINAYINGPFQHNPSFLSGWIAHMHLYMNKSQIQLKIAVWKMVTKSQYHVPLHIHLGFHTQNTFLRQYEKNYYAISLFTANHTSIICVLRIFCSISVLSVCIDFPPIRRCFTVISSFRNQFLL